MGYGIIFTSMHFLYDSVIRKAKEEELRKVMEVRCRKGL